MKLLVAEDDKNLRFALKTLFQRNQYTVDAVENGLDALEYLRIGNYDGAVLDVMMPQMDGISVVQQLRREHNQTPVLLLTAKSEIEDRVEGLDAGADDYLPKPFDIRELLARVRVLTRQNSHCSSLLSVGNLCLDTVSCKISGPKDSQILVNKEYQTLLLLMQNPGTVISADRILQNAWGQEGEENALWTVIYNLRKKLQATGADPEIKTKRNLGYILEDCHEESC